MTHKISQKWFVAQLMRWYEVNGRHDLPWKKPLSAYRVWVSEVMLQQTQVNTVIPYFENFMQAFPNIKTLANSPLDKVLHFWSGLGYYARARNMHKAANIIMTEFKGVFPKTLDLVEQLPGIGRSTAGAILAQTFNIRAPILDGNVKRVLSRLHCVKGWYGEKAVLEKLWELAEIYTPHEKVADFTQAMMDLGATCCTRSKPNCIQCPLQKNCLSYQSNQTHVFPYAKPKKKIPTKSICMALIISPQGEVLLHQRPLQGIWAGLWSLPEFEKEEDIIGLSKKMKFKAKANHQLPVFKHTFTHFHLNIHPFMTILKKKPIQKMHVYEWIDEGGLKMRGLAAPVKKLIQAGLLAFTSQSD